MLMASDQWSGDRLPDAGASDDRVDPDVFALLRRDAAERRQLQHRRRLNIDYFSPAYYKVFARKAIPDGGLFAFSVSQGYKHLLAQGWAHDGLVPDSSNLEDSTSLARPARRPTATTPAERRGGSRWTGAGTPIPTPRCTSQKVGAFFDGMRRRQHRRRLLADRLADQRQPQPGFQRAGRRRCHARLPVAGRRRVQLRSSAPPSGNAAYFPQSLRVITHADDVGQHARLLAAVARRSSPPPDGGGCYWVMSQKLPLIAISDSTPHEALK